MPDIAGATSATYTLVTADLGRTISVTVTATNASGSGNATSLDTAVVTPADPAGDFLARTSGLDGTHTAAYTALINGLYADGVWAKFDVLRIYATQDQATALLNLVSASYPATIVGSPTFTADRGFTGVDGSNTVYLDSGFNSATAVAAKYTQNSCHLATWTLNSTGMGAPDIGAQVTGGTSVAFIYSKYTDGHTYVRPQTTGASGGDSGILTDKRGLIGANRSSSVQVDGYQNGISIYSNGSTASTALINLTFGEIGFHQTSNSVGCGSQQAAASWGSSLTPTDWLNYYNRLRTYMIAVGAANPVADFLARTSGLDGTHTTAYTDLINGLITDGIWWKLDVLYVFATQDSTTAKLNLVQNAYNATAIGAPTFTADTGFTGAGAGDYINTNFNPITAAAPKFTQNSAHMSVWSNTTTALNPASIGATNTSSIVGGSLSSIVQSQFPDGGTYYRLNLSAVAGGQKYLSADAKAFHLANRSASNAWQGYRNATQTTSGSEASTAINNLNIYALGFNGGGTGTGIGAQQQKMISVGGSLTPTEVANFYSRLNTYMVAVGGAAADFLSRTSGLDTTHVNAYTALINGLVADGLWLKFDILYIFATQNAATAGLNLVSTSYPASINGTPTFAADRGYTGVSGAYINTLFNGTVGGAKLVQNSAHIAGWNVGDVGVNNIPMCGVNAGGYVLATHAYFTDGSAYFYVNQSGNTSAAVSSSQGFYLGSRTNSTTVDGYKNNTRILNSASAASVAPTNYNIVTLGMNNSNAVTFNPNQQAMFSVGSGLTPTEAANFYSRLNTYMLAVGVVASAETTAFLARTSGLNATHINAYTALINGLVLDGIWSKLDVLHIYATQDSATALLNLVSSSYAATLIGTPTFTADRGFTGGTTGGTTGLASTGFIPSSASSPKYTQNSAHISMWSLTSGGLNADGIGVNNLSVICPRYSNGNCYASVNSGFGAVTVGSGDGSGHYICNRSNSTNTQLYRNGVSFGTNTSAASLAVPTIAMYSIGNNNGGTAMAWGGQEAMISIGASLTATEMLALYNRLRTYMTAVGVP